MSNWHFIKCAQFSQYKVRFYMSLVPFPKNANCRLFQSSLTNQNDVQVQVKCL